MPNTPLSPSTIEYASLLNYSPRGQSELAVRSKQFVRDGVKNDRPNILRRAVAVLEDHAFDELDGFFGNEVILVPVPRSTPLVENGLWPSLRICEELMAAGLGNRISTLLTRSTSVRRACTARPGERPMPEEHIETIKVEAAEPISRKFLLVDDFVTRGSILTATSFLLRNAFPQADVQAFALVNTLGIHEEITNLVEPRKEAISYREGILNRGSWLGRIGIAPENPEIAAMR